MPAKAKNKILYLTFFRCLKCQNIRKTLDKSIVEMTLGNQLILNLKKIHKCFMSS